MEAIRYLIYFNELSNFFIVQKEELSCMCEHPLSDITIAGEAVSPLPGVFHTFLQTISDVMMHLPNGSSLQVNYMTLKNNLDDSVGIDV